MTAYEGVDDFVPLIATATLDVDVWKTRSSVLSNPGTQQTYLLSGMQGEPRSELEVSLHKYICNSCHVSYSLNLVSIVTELLRLQAV